MPSPSPRGPSHILFVDAASPTHDRIRHTLEQEHGGFCLTEASTPEEAAACLARRAYDAVLTTTDQVAGQVFAVLDAVHACDPNLPVVLMAGADADAIAAEALQRGATDYVIALDEHLRHLPRTLLAAIEKAHLARAHALAEQQLKTRLAQQAAIVELGQRALAGAPVPELMEEALALLTRTLGLRMGMVLELMPGGRLLRVTAGTGWKAGVVGRAMFSAGAHSMPGYTLFTGNAVFSEDLHLESRFDLPALLAEHQVVSGMSVVIAGNERPFGVFCAFAPRRERFSEDDLHFLQALANVLSTAIDRKQSEARLRNSEDRYRTLIEHARDVIFTLSVKGRITSLNPAFEALTGFTRADWLGKPFLKLVHADDAVAARAIYEKSAGSTRPSATELRIRTSDGGFLVGEFTTQPNFDGSDGIVGIGRDISERKRVEAALIAAKEKAEEMNNLKSAFLTNMSHEFRTPLTSIIGFANIMAEEAQGEHRELARLVEMSGNRLLNTLNSVLDLAMLEAGSLQLNNRRLNLVEEVMEKVRSHHAHAAEKGLQLHVRPRTPRIEAYLDRACLDRILNNLLNNAIKFTEFGEVTVELSQRGNRIELTVSDTGVGIAADFVPHLFDDFKQEDMGIDRPYEGTGLGLTITKKLVDMMEGEIRVNSQKGKGSTFVVSFPHNRFRSEERVSFAPGASHPSIDPMPVHPRVLILEDDPDMLVLVERFLEEGYALKTARDEEEALRLARAHVFDVVLMDINLGRGRTGVEVLHELRAVPGYAATPIIAVTAYALPGDREHFLESGFTAYLGKPFTRRMLKRKIDEMMEA